MSNCGTQNNPQPIPVITAGCRKRQLTSSDLQQLVEFMESFLSSATVDEIKNYFHENECIFMELPILDVCSMIMNKFRISMVDMSEVLDFIMTSLMGYQKLTRLMYVIDGFFFKLKLTDDGKTGNVYIEIESISPMDPPFERKTTLSIQQKLGFGSFSVVYLANVQKDDQSHLSKCAIKFFSDIDTGHDDFNREIKILLVLRGTPGVINVEFVVEISVLGKTFFAYGMPYFENKTLDDYAERPILDVFKMLRHLAQTMKVFHEMGVFHCDVKPENILIDSSGSLVLADFGIGEHDGSNCWSINLNSVRYSPSWRDPWNWEQKKRNGRNFKVSILSEMWALLLAILDYLSRRNYQDHRRFAVFRNGNYFNQNSQMLVDDAIDCIFPSDSLESGFFKKWLEINTFMTFTTTIPENNPTFLDDRYREFFYDVDLVIDAVQPSKTESSDSD